MPSIFVDTRQQKGKHDTKHDWFRAEGIEMVPKALPFGDYADASGRSNIVVDTKQDVNELAMDVGREHARFVRECDRAREAGYRLVILVEDGERYNDRALLDQWVPFPCRRCRGRKCGPYRKGKCRNKRKPMQGWTVRSVMEGIEQNHGCIVEFVDKQNAARRICELLGLEVSADGLSFGPR